MLYRKANSILIERKDLCERILVARFTIFHNIRKGNVGNEMIENDSKKQMRLTENYN